MKGTNRFVALVMGLLLLCGGATSAALAAGGGVGSGGGVSPGPGSGGGGSGSGTDTGGSSAGGSGSGNPGGGGGGAGGEGSFFLTPQQDHTVTAFAACANGHVGAQIEDLAADGKFRFSTERIGDAQKIKACMAARGFTFNW